MKIKIMRMMRIRIAIVVIALCCSNFVYAQGQIAQDDAIKPLNIGDKVPDIEFKDVVNYPKKKVKLSDFKGQMVILDFWGTYCCTCIAMFP